MHTLLQDLKAGPGHICVALSGPAVAVECILLERAQPVREVEVELALGGLVARGAALSLCESGSPAAGVTVVVVTVDVPVGDAVVVAWRVGRRMARGGGLRGGQRGQGRQRGSTWESGCMGMGAY